MQPDIWLFYYATNLPTKCEQKEYANNPGFPTEKSDNVTTNKVIFGVWIVSMQPLYRYSSTDDRKLIRTK